MKSRNVRKLMDEKAATPDTANRLLSLISILMEHAISEGWRDDNPAFGVKRIKHRSAGFAPGANPISPLIVTIILSARANGLSSNWQ